MNFVTLLNPDMNELLLKNLSFLREINPELVQRLQAVIELVQIRDGLDLYFSNSLVLPECEQALIASLNGQLSKPNRIRVARIENNQPSLPLKELVRDVVDSHKPVLLANLPNLNIASNGSQASVTSLSRDWLLLGSLTLKSIELLLEQQSDNVALMSLTLVEADPKQLLSVLQLLDLQVFVSRCRELNIGFHLIYQEQSLPLQEELYAYLTSSLPLALHGLVVMDSPLRSPALEELRGWLFSQSGIGYRFLGTLGSTTDEINQLMAAAWNALSPGRARWIHGPVGGQASLEHTAVVVGSGPSLDAQLSWISDNRDHLTLFAAGSAIGALLRAGIIPDAAVFLERGTGLFEDVIELANEGYDLKPIRLIASITTDPRLRSLFGEAILFHRPASTALALFPGLDSAALLHGGPESNNAAVDVALHLGFAKLLLIGCDFAAVDRRHPRSVQASGYTPRAFNEPVRGNMGRTVFSEPSLLLARDALSASLRFFDKVEVRRLGEGALIPSAIDTTIQELHNDGWLSVLSPWAEIDAQCPVFAPGGQSLIDLASDARKLLRAYAEPLMESIRRQTMAGWSIALHRQFAPLFPQFPPVGTPPTALLVHRLFREIFFHALAPLEHQRPGSPAWSTLVDELEITIIYVRDLFDAVLLWIEQINPETISLSDWDPPLIADELVAIVEALALDSKLP
jgi:hypothetical protein